MTPYVADVQEDNPIDFILKVMAAIADIPYQLVHLSLLMLCTVSLDHCTD